ncbi:hypothetical protein HU200_019204 [Digitaria exilis]|uniref:Uncharacterized protein n=1 Tax=Digitaria exilis TaxID=1010633 RepID=A0A835KFE0_9POAL|nr:hypothetical protein HU200_019204 [Digitaria exilis]
MSCRCGARELRTSATGPLRFPSSLCVPSPGRPFAVASCTMSRPEKEEQQRDASAAAQWRGGGGAVAVPPRRGRWFDEESPTTAAAAGRAGWRCRSCAAVAIADCVALGCCPCAVVSLLGLALVKAPLVVGRRCVGRLRRRRRRFLLHKKKRVRDVAAAAAATTTTIKATTACVLDKGAKAEKTPPPGEAARTAADAPREDTVAASEQAPAPPGQGEVELAWLDEMYRVGYWGFGRVSFSGKTP